jgi:hypothetical protein
MSAVGELIGRFGIERSLHDGVTRALASVFRIDTHRSFKSPVIGSRLVASGLRHQANVSEMPILRQENFSSLTTQILAENSNQL